MRLLGLGTLVILLGTALSAMADEKLMARAVESCGSDITAYCPHVKMGQGRILACLLANDDKISTECGMALNEVTLNIEEVRAQGKEIVEACEADRETFCPTEYWAEGGVVRCLLKQSRVVEGASLGCRHALEKHGLK
jgi:hypothetical protein